MRSIEHYLNTATSLSAVLLELVRLRTSLLNRCDFCEQTHASELRKHHEPESRIEAVAHWQNTDAFTPRERAALAWADCVTQVQQTQIADQDFAAVSEFFKHKELVDLTLAISSMNAWNRLGVAFRPSWDPAHHAERQAAKQNGADPEIQPAEETQTAQAGETRSAVGDDGGKVSED